jgi:hypothetical protein
MGEPITDLVLQAFEDELEKIAGPFFKNTFELAGRLGSPMKGLKEGWRLMSPHNALKTPHTAVGREVMEDVISTVGANTRGQMGGGTWKQKLVDPLRRTFGAGEHLGGNSVPLSSAAGIQGNAEELSRRGWTGQGKVTKYLPLGEKAQFGMGAAASVPTVSAATEPNSTTGPAEAALSAGAGLGTNILAYGTGGWGIAAPLLATAAGGAIGRRIDGMMQRKNEGTNG